MIGTILVKLAMTLIDDLNGERACDSSNDQS